MDDTRLFTADTEADLWQQVAADLDQLDSPLDYRAQLRLDPYLAQLEVDVDPGGGFEGGFTLTRLALRVPGHPPLRFALYEQTWLQELGKLLGQEDVVLGYPELDAAFIITTNDQPTLQQLLADEALRHTLLRYPTLRLTLEPASLAAEAELLLTFSYEAEMLTPAQLQEVYHALLLIVQQLAAQPAATPPLP